MVACWRRTAFPFIRRENLAAAPETGRIIPEAAGAEMTVPLKMADKFSRVF
jgi:hypothetical protein